MDNTKSDKKELSLMPKKVQFAPSSASGSGDDVPPKITTTTKITTHTQPTNQPLLPKLPPHIKFSLDRLTVNDALDHIYIYLWEHQDLIHRICIPHNYYYLPEQYVLKHSRGLNLQPIRQYIDSTYEKKILALSDFAEIDYFLSTALGKTLDYLSYCEEIIGTGLENYNTDYSDIEHDNNQISGSNDGRLSEFDNDILKVKPDVVLIGLGMLYENIKDQIQRYLNMDVDERAVLIKGSESESESEDEEGDGSGVDGGKNDGDNVSDGQSCATEPDDEPNLFESGESLATFYCTILIYTSYAAAYIRICRFALVRFDEGDTKGCNHLMNQHLDNPYVLRLHGHGLSKLKSDKLENAPKGNDK
ncbi:hypothetical protein H4219_005451 [Mycoemilia scoparia]|uniref:Uncharacterized protein n=1 Tax=Mycoemilia scoparia TaxID=417184 RepID=A0A9W7ZT12_9FUNG|nr:hypothetical protein H4219_005451 [Mycoemilia scoparia]